VPHEPCCIIKNGIIVFFYVDGIVLVYPEVREIKARELLKQLGLKYKLTGGDELKWFL
jgi:hypothetical protein